MHPAVYQFNHLVDRGYITRDPWQAATQKSRDVAIQRKMVVEFVNQLTRDMSLNKALSEFESRLNQQLLPIAIQGALSTLKRPGKTTIRNWCTAFSKEGGVNNLLPQYSGTNRATYGWEARAIELYHKTSKPSLSKVAKDLKRKFGFRDVKEHNVRYFFSTLPADLQEKSPWRLGRKQYNDALREHIMRTTENLPVGCLYQADGHQIDVYLKHPENGSLWRPELTVFIDVRSRYVVGWYLSVAESAISTMAALSHGMGTHDHVPALLYIDNGSGFKGKLMNSKTAGFYASFGIEPIFAIPGNAKAKNIERWFRIMEDDFGKDWDTYCGYDQSPDVSRHFSTKKMRKLEAEGKIHWPTLEEWVAGFTDWIDEYHNRPHPEEKDTTPQLLWNELERVPVEDKALLVRPRKEVVVKRSLITFDSRKYKSEFLYQFEGQSLIAEYDLHDDSSIRLFDMNGRWLTTAVLKSKKDYIPVSRIEQASRNRLVEQQKRLANKMRENEEQAGLRAPLHMEQVSDLSQLENSVYEMEQAKAPQNDDFNIDAVTQELLNSTPNEEQQETDDLALLDMLEQQQ